MPRGRPKRTDSYVKLTLNVAADTRMQLQMLAAHSGTTMSRVVEVAAQRLANEMGLKVTVSKPLPEKKS